MTILSGIFARTGTDRLKDSDCEALKQVLSRNPADNVISFKDNRVFLAKVDIGAFMEPGFRVDPAGSISMLAGELLLAQEDESLFRTRTYDLDLLHRECDRENWEFLKKANGVFCAIHYQPNKDRLTLIADKLCIRPLYFCEGEEYVVFATALRILEGLSIVPKVMDLRGVAEIASLGYALGTRTPYTNIFLLKAAEIVQFSDDTVVHSQYWRWDQIPQSRQPESELLQQAYRKFTTAIARRLRLDTATVAFLSGGLDSRCVVAALRSRNVTVHTFNFSHPGTQDQVLGAEFARRVGSIHTEVTWEIEAKWSMMMASALKELSDRAPWPIQRPKLVWSGDGGSVGLGHVYMSQVIVNLIRDGKLELAMKAFLAQQNSAVVKGLFKARVAHYLSEILETGIREELDDIHCDDPARSFHIFLLLNDQRRHLSSHFEDIDLHRIEFQLPFYDSEFLSSILECPIDLCLGHLFYAKWLKLFHPVVSSVPWQAYPGHEPCPLPIPEGLRYQWQPDHLKDLNKKKKHRLLQQADELLKTKHFPDEIMSKEKLHLATWVYRIGLRDYGYVIKTARTFHEYWVLCGGNYNLP